MSTNEAWTDHGFWQSSLAKPPRFGERDILRYFDRILTAIDVPLVVQDFNPGGPTVTVEFIAKLHSAHPHFCYIKLEEPLIASKVEPIVQEASGEVAVLAGWGGMYMLELIPARICGVTPSLGAEDIMARVFRMAQERQRDQAYRAFQAVLPQIVFSLLNLELLHHIEKSLLVARGIIKEAAVRDATLELSPHDRQHMLLLNREILEALDRLGLPRNPCAASGTVAFQAGFRFWMSRGCEVIQYSMLMAKRGGLERTGVTF